MHIQAKEAVEWPLKDKKNPQQKMKAEYLVWELRKMNQMVVEEN